MRPSITKRELLDRTDALLDTLRATNANLGVTNAKDAVEYGVEVLVDRGVIVSERSRFRIRERNVLRYYARSLDHLLASPSRRTH